MQDTRRRIIDALRMRGGATVAELARALHLTRSAVRSHLIALRAEGFVTGRAMRPGKRRPSVVYSLTAAADSLFPNAYDEFAASLLEEIKLRGARDLDDLLHRIGDRWIARDLPHFQGLRGHERVIRAKELLAERGFMPALERTRDGHLLREHNCPVMPLAVPHPEICDMVHRWMEALFGTPLARVQCMRKGDPFSAYTLTVSPASPGS